MVVGVGVGVVVVVGSGAGTVTVAVGNGFSVALHRVTPFAVGSHSAWK